MHNIHYYEVFYKQTFIKITKVYKEISATKPN